MPHDVFISYSSKNKTIADATCAAMEQRKIRCWIAPRDVQPGQAYAATLVRAIAESRVLVLILSEDANRSVHVLREVGEAVDNGIPIIPLRIESVEPSQEMRYYIKSIHWLDAISPPMERHLEKLTNTVQALLGVVEPGREVSVPIEASRADVKPRGIPKWAMGVIAFALIGLLGGFALWFLPRLNASGAVPENPAAVVDTNPAATVPTSDSNSVLSEWKAIEFSVPGDGLWREEDGRYTAIGSKDTIAWSQDMFGGDIEVSMDIESSNPFSAANIILYGTGRRLAPGNLIFVIASDQQAIQADTIYEGGTYLYSSLWSLEYGEQKHSVLISIHDRRASLFLDGEEIASAFIGENIHTSGKIGLLKYWEIHDVTFSNIRVRASDIIK